jgi:hypothetical protein
MKKCTKCEKIKPLDQFGKHKNMKDGLATWCKNCKSEYDKKYWANPEKYKRRKSPEGYKYCTKCKQDKPIGQFHKSKKGCKLGLVHRCKECTSKEAKKRWYDDHEETLRKNREYYAKNKERINANAKRYRPKTNKWWNNRYHNDINFRLSECMRGVIRKSLRDYIDGDIEVGTSTRELMLNGMTRETLLGCTIPEFAEYIESQFEPWMTWDNWGNTVDSWQIDHIIPRIAIGLDLSDIATAITVFHYTNQRPLSYADNHRSNSDYAYWTEVAKDMGLKFKI